MHNFALNKFRLKTSYCDSGTALQKKHQEAEDLNGVMVGPNVLFKRVALKGAVHLHEL